MKRRIRLALLCLAAATVMLAAACESGSSQETRGQKSVRGVITEVRVLSLTQAESITLRTSDGRFLTFRIGPEVDQLAFNPSHLREHMLGAHPVTVDYREEGTSLIAVRIAD